MNDLTVYLLKSSLCLAVFYAFFMTLLRKKTCYNYNRAYLVLSGIFSILLPIISLPLPGETYSGMSKVLLTPFVIKYRTLRYFR